MVIRVSRPLQYDVRFGKQQTSHGELFAPHQIAFSDQAIQKDPIRALVELITNSDDSYNKIGGIQEQKPGLIEISITYQGKNPILEVKDWAAGMDDQILDAALGSYSRETSSGTDRGYFGRGLKDAILALGEGHVTSVAENTVRQAWLGVRDGIPYYEAFAAQPIEQSLLAQVQSGSTVTIQVNRRDINIPTYNELGEQIRLHFMLRDILRNKKMAIVFHERSSQNQPIQTTHLRYHDPPRRLVLDNSLTIQRFNVPYRVVIYETSSPLSIPRQVGSYAEAGILITDGNAILDNTLAGFETDPDGAFFFGHLICPYLNKLMRENEPIVKTTRAGLEWQHEFARELRITLEERLNPLIEDRARRSRSERFRNHEISLKERLRRIISDMNSIATSEFAIALPEGPSGNQQNEQRKSQPNPFQRIIFEDIDPNGHRIRYDKTTGDISVSVQHPSLAPYVGANKDQILRTPQVQIIVAELLLQILCAEIARIGVDSGLYPALSASRVETIRQKIGHLEDVYSARMHRSVVDGVYITSNTPIPYA